MQRHPDWAARFHAYLSAHRDTPFHYGTFDCCLFVCDAIREMTGTDLAAWFRGKYSTRKEAFALIHERTGKYGVGAVAQCAAEEHGLKTIPVAFAQRGDMVVVGEGMKAVFGIIDLNGIDVLCMDKTIRRVSKEHATAAWRV